MDRATEYQSEPVQFAPLHLADLDRQAALVTEAYRNQVIHQVNDHCLRLAVFEEEYAWHIHPGSDELFVVMEGCLEIDLDSAPSLRLTPGQSVVVPAGTVHRTRAIGRTVNLCFEKLGAETVFTEPPGQGDS